MGVLAMGYGLMLCGLPLFTPLASSPYSLITSNLLPYCLIPCQMQCFDADAKQMQERYEVERVKTSEEFGEHSKIVRRTLKSIWCGSQTKDESKRNGQKRAAKLHLSGFSLDIYLAMPK